LESIASGARPELVIRLKIEPETMNSLHKIEGIIESSPGENPVIFELTRPGDFRARLRPRKTRKVKADRDLMARLREVCGEEAVLLEKTAGGNGTP